MRWRVLLSIGVGLYASGLGLGFVAWGLLAPDEPLGAGAAIISLLLSPVTVLIFGFLAGWFGRERDHVVLVAIGVGIAATVGVNVVVLAVGDWHPVALVFGPVAGFIAAMVGRLTWWVGNAVCELRGLPSASELVGPAFPKEVPSDAMWTTRAAPSLRSTLENLAEHMTPGAPLDAGAVGVLLGVPRDRPAVVALVADRLGIQRVDMEGAALAHPIVLDKLQLACVSIRSEAADGTSRDHVNAFDDVIAIESSDDELRLRLRLPYERRGVGRGINGPDAIRSWLRTNAARYR